MHVCVHEWTKNVLNEARPDRELSKLALSSFAHYLPPSNAKDNWRKKPRLAKHIHACMKIVRQLPSETDDESMSFGLNALADFAKAEGELAEAEPLYWRVLRAREQTLGPDHEKTLGILNNLGTLYDRQKKWDEAEETLKRGLRAFDEGHDTMHPSALTIALDLGCLLS